MIITIHSLHFTQQFGQSITLGISNSRALVATACKSTNAEHAVVRIYSTQTYKPVGEPLHGHILTVTRVAFSPDDRYVLTVSRDRSWRLFEVQEHGGDHLRFMTWSLQVCLSTNRIS